MQPDYTSYVLHRILEGHNCDHAFIEVFTSAYGGWWKTTDDYCWPLWHMAETRLGNGATPTFARATSPGRRLLRRSTFWPREFGYPNAWESPPSTHHPFSG